MIIRMSRSFIQMANLSIILCVWTGLICFANWAGAELVLSFEDFSIKDRNAVGLGITCPNNRTKCTERQTCCVTKHNSYHCCRYANAVCCPDKFHCCPHGSTCDTKRKRCSRRIEKTNAGMDMYKEPKEWPVVEEREKIQDSIQVCPNNRTKCKDSQTCCVTKHGSYHCCKFENAVCCSDKYHCCPQDSTCDMKRHRCVKSNSEMLKLIPSNTLIGAELVLDPQPTSDLTKIEKDQTCPNNKTTCKDTKTCCITKHGNYYCCPHKNAVCCSDKYQCCPESTTCDLKNKKCISSSFSVSENQYERKVVDHVDTADETKIKKDQTCPNNKTTCKDTKTCCITKHGNYYCCPHKNAVCCSDKYQCCPEATTCDLKNKKCISSSFSVDPVDTADEIKIKKDQTCPNNKTTCKDTKTCCITKHGNYYCCPHKNAVCCSDKYQCCPEATTCDLKNKKCISSLFSVDTHVEDTNIDNLQDLEPAVPIHFNNLFTDLKLGKKCPNSKLSCPGHKNCCVMDGGKFGCCKFDKGVCCPDLKTCCPHGTECDVAKGKCTSNPLNLVPF